jgi:hypothetical protein
MTISQLSFPSFYAECAYRDGARAVRDGNFSGVASYMRHGQAEPVGMDWFNRGAQAWSLGLISGSI